MKRQSRRILPIAAAASMLLACNAAAQVRCQLTAIGTVNVAAVRDGRTLLLSDGRELRLAGIEVTDGSRAALQALAIGHPLRLERLGQERDRYGRLVAFAFVGDAHESLQQVMLAQGQARVAMHVGNKACAGALLKRGTGGAGGPARALGQSKFRPFVGRKSLRITGRARPFRVGGRQGLVGARKRGHYICKFRAPLDTRFHSDHSTALASGICRGRHRAESA